MELMTEKDAARYIGGTVSCMRKWRRQVTTGETRGMDLPPFVRLGGNIRYRREDLDRWVERNIIGVEG